MTAAGSAVTLAIESSVIFASRAALFYASRRYLLRSLYHDLQDIYPDAERITTTETDEVEMEVLPTASLPAGASRKAAAASSSRKRAFHSALSRTLFSLSFSENCVLFLLLMCQGLDIFHPRTRQFNWYLSLYLVLSSILLFIPLSYSLVLSYRSSTSSHNLQRPSIIRIVFTTLPVALFLFILSFIPLPAGVLPSNFSVRLISRLIVVGTFILGTLSGFGAVNNAWNYFPRLSKKEIKDPTDAEVSSAEQGLRRIRDDLAKRRQELEKLQEESQTKQDGMWLSRMMPSMGGGTQLSNLTQEITGLEALEYQMSRNVDRLRRHQSEIRFSKTLSGRMFTWCGRLFAIYCVYRIIVAIFSLIAPIRSLSKSPADPTEETSTTSFDFLTVVLAYLVSFLPSVHLTSDEIAVISRQISLALIGVIILSSIRLVLRGVARVLRVSSRNLGTSLMLLMLAQLMGIYLLSTLIQLRTSFPPPPARPDTTPDDGTVNLFSTLPEYQMFGSLFDGSFLISAFLTLVVFWFDERINGLGSSDF